MWLHVFVPSPYPSSFFFQNVIDDRLKHVMSGVVFATIRVFFHLTESLPHLHEDILDRIKSINTLSPSCTCHNFSFLFVSLLILAPLLTAIGSSSPEVTYTCLQHIELLQYQNPALFNDKYHNFFCRSVGNHRRQTYTYTGTYTA